MSDLSLEPQPLQSAMLTISYHLSTYIRRCGGLLEGDVVAQWKEMWWLNGRGLCWLIGRRCDLSIRGDLMAHWKVMWWLIGRSCGLAMERYVVSQWEEMWWLNGRSLC